MRRKGEGDFVTATDLLAETILREFFARHHPEHGFLGEEGGSSGGAQELVWVVDPIDGTSNFARNLPVHAISIACLHHGQPVAAALHCWPEDVSYWAGLGLGAFRAGRRIRLAPGRLDDGAMLGVQWLRGARRVPFLASLLATGARVRVLGCTVVQLCEVVRGCLDGNVQEQGRIWDIAGCGLVLTEAGGRFTTWSGEPVFPFPSLAGDRHYATIAAAPAVHRRLLACLQR